MSANTPEWGQMKGVILHECTAKLSNPNVSVTLHEGDEFIFSKFVPNPTGGALGFWYNEDKTRSGAVSREHVSLAEGYCWEARGAMPIEGAQQTALAVGDYGKVLEISADCTWAKVQFDHRGGFPSSKKGWVPVRAIYIGVKNKHEGPGAPVRKLLVNGLLSDDNTIITTPGTGTRTYKAALAFVTALHDNRDSLGFVKPRIFTLLNTPNRRMTAANKIVNSTVPAVRNVLDSASPSLQKLIAAAPRIRPRRRVPPVEPNDPNLEGGVYLRLYDLMNHYVGSTNLLEGRMHDHDARASGNAKSTKTMHSQITRAAKQKDYLAIAKYTTQEVDYDREFVELHEQFLIAWFTSYLPSCLTAKSELSSRLTQMLSVSSSDTSENVSDDSMPEIMMISNDDDPEEAVTLDDKADKKDYWILCKEAATCLSLVSIPAFSAAKAQLPADMFGSSKGVNVQSPVASGFESNLVYYTRQTMPNGYQVFRARPTTLRAQGQTGSATVGCFPWSSPHPLKRHSHTFPVLKKDVPDMRLKDPVALAYEVTPPGIEHPYAWVQLPTVCREKDDREAKRLAIRFERTKPDGKTIISYLRSEERNHVVNPNHPGSIKVLLEAMAMLRSLTRVALYPSTARSQDIDYGELRIFNVIRNHREQEYQITEDTGELTYAQPSGLRSDLEIKALLQDAGFGDIGRVFQEESLPADWATQKKITKRRESSKIRESCDRCILNSQRKERWPQGSTAYMLPFNKGGNTSPCETKGLGTQGMCTHCAKVGIYCTWTDSDDLFSSKEKQCALYPAHLAFEDNVGDDPMLQVDQVREMFEEIL